MHHRPNLSCGYDLAGNCKGIYILLVPEEISCNGINNFLALPTKFQGVVKDVPFIDLGAAPFSIACIEEYDPLGNGLFDAYGKLGGLGTSEIGCYSPDPELRPGILLPSPLLSAFSPSLLLAVPTVAIGNISSVRINSLSANIGSACSGFKITAKRIHANVITVTVTAGVFQAVTNLLEEPLDTSVKGIVWEGIGSKIKLTTADIGEDLEEDTDEDTDDTETSDDDLEEKENKPKALSGKLMVKNIQVWLVAQEDITDHTWTGFLTFTPDGKNWWILNKNWKKLDLLHIKKRMLGTVSYVNGKITIIQSECSPVDLRDGTDKKIPGDLDYYAFVYDTSKGRKRWIALKECG